MTDYLFFRLYGPMASWGSIAVGETRHSEDRPSKSAVLGLIGAALGVRREEEEKQQKLARGYGFAVRVENRGNPMTDYHTAQVPSSTARRKNIGYPTRRAEITSLQREDLKTIISRRDYLTDALAFPVLWESGVASYALKEIEKALNRPNFLLYLGRKSCPLALPMEAQIKKGNSLQEAFLKVEFREIEEMPSLQSGEEVSWYWERSKEAGMEEQHVYKRYDVPLSKRGWRFDYREEAYTSIKKEG